MNMVIRYEQVAWMQPVKDRDGKTFYMLGKVSNPDKPNTLAVTPMDGSGETMFFCLEHEVVYGLKDVCLDCRMRPVAEPV